MDKQKLQQQVNELKTKLAVMEAELAKPEVTINYWRPAEGDNFFYIDAWGITRQGLANDYYTPRYRELAQQLIKTHSKELTTYLSY